jgi:hypothetical protein
MRELAQAGNEQRGAAARRRRGRQPLFTMM